MLDTHITLLDTKQTGVENMLAHLVARGMNPTLYKIALTTETATFFLYNPTGKLVGYHQYRPGAKKHHKEDPKLARYYTYLPRGVDGLFGLEQDNGRGRLYVVEGIFKASKLHSLGENAIAVLGATPKRLKSQFKIWNRELFAIGDNDSAGRKLVNIVKEGLQSPRDLDEMTDKEVLDLLSEYYNQGYEAYYNRVSINPYQDFMFPPEWEDEWNNGWLAARDEDYRRSVEGGNEYEF